MPHRHPHKPVHHVKPKYKKMALIAAAAAMLSTTPLPGIPAATVHASANDMSATTSQQIGKTNDSSSQINLGDTTKKIPNPSKQENRAQKIKKNISKTAAAPQKTVAEANQKTKNSQANENTTKTPVVSPKATGETNEETKTPQANENITKTPVVNPKATEETKTTENKEKSPQPQPSKDTTKDPTTQSTPKEESKSPVSADTPNHYKEVLDISATAYAPGPHDNDQWGDKTYTGTTVRPGIIAVDPKLIPLGSRVYIEYPDGHGEYATAEDTGGAIKGNRIDVAKQTVNEAEDFGIQKVKVYVVNSPKNT